MTGPGQPTANIGHGDLTVANIMRHGARWHADRTVQVVGQPEATLTYGEVPGRSAALASLLAGHGIGPGSVVGSLLWNHAEHLLAYMAVPAMGALLHTLNPRLSQEQLAFTINRAADEVVIVDASLAGQLAAVVDRCPTVRVVLVVGGSTDELAGWHGEVVPLAASDLDPGASFAWPEVDERAPATLCFTTGTTGDPKGVAYSHRSIWLHAMSLCTANAVGIHAGDRGYIVVPMFHANAWGYPYATYWAGADLVLCGRHNDAATIVEAVRTYEPTFSNGVPTVWNEVLRHLQADGGGLAALDRVVLGGAPIPEALRLGLDAHGVQALQGWGMTETSPLVTLNRPPRPDEADDPLARASYQGRVLAGVDLRLVDPDSGAELPTDGVAVGELELRGPWIADSYFRADEPSKFRDGWLRTGDVGTVDHLGYVHLTDRAKDVIKSGGEWISSVELELTIAGHPDVFEAAVIGVPDAQWDERPCAVVVLEAGREPDIAALQTHLGASVPRWWLPERWAFCAEIPRTSVGKFDKVELRRRYAAGDLDVVHVERGAASPR